MGTFSPPVRLTVAGLPALLLASVVFAQTAPASAPALNAAAPSAARGATLAASCAGCHGPSGRAPDLTGRPAAQTQAALVAYRSGARRHPVMQGVAARLSDQDIVDLAAHYAQAGAPPTAPVPTPPPSTPPATTTPAAAATPLARGKALYLEGAPARNILACAVCHGEDGQGAEALGIPSIAGLGEAATLAALKSYRAMPPVGIAYPDAMRIALKPMTDADLAAVSAYVGTLK
ncbi:c-type cytochrome [Deinococcus multiflagellatus]|uniref:C-type cytochrome n=1 Tax=Deinococcus multiflagellatus TaxID=1656887 RepID=A0ABW1ZPB8_9DEIO|nr:c-type cytochrome [Deinococcus multiflagellatus]MBZ9712691.1 cytochrome c [Deinococcus multiflagellatus]